MHRNTHMTVPVQSILFYTHDMFTGARNLCMGREGTNPAAEIHSLQHQQSPDQESRDIDAPQRELLHPIPHR